MFSSFKGYVVKLVALYANVVTHNVLNFLCLFLYGLLLQKHINLVMVEMQYFHWNKGYIENRYHHHIRRYGG